MRRSASTVMLLLLLAACKRPTSLAGDGGAPTEAGVASARPTVPTRPAEAVPGQYGRFFVDGHRFSASYPATPEVKTFGEMMTGVEAHDSGIGYAILCGPAVGPYVGPRADGGVTNDRERKQVVGAGKLVAESHPTFYGWDAYEVRAQIDAGERIMRFIPFAGRYCSVGVELPDMAHEQDATRFIESFRPEPPPAMPASSK